MSEPSGQDRAYKRFRRDAESGEATPSTPNVFHCLCEDLPALTPLYRSAGECNNFSVDQLPLHFSVNGMKVNPNVTITGLSEADGFKIAAIYQISNFAHDVHFNMKAIEIANKNHQPVSLRHAYHGVTNYDNVIPIILNGLKCGTRGFFGKGIYATDSPLKANDYSPSKGDPNALRVMLRCQVIPGCVKKFDIGRFDRDLTVAPEGYDSVSGFIRRSSEIVLYDPYQIRVTEVIIYRFTKTSEELDPIRTIPPGAVAGRTVFITASLSEFFSKIQERCNSTQLPACKKLVSDLLKRQITPTQFIQEISSLLRTTVPSDLEERLVRELAKCDLHLTNSTADEPAPTPAPAAAPTRANSEKVQPSPSPAMPRPVRHAEPSWYGNQERPERLYTRPYAQPYARLAAARPQIVYPPPLRRTDSYNPNFDQGSRASERAQAIAQVRAVPLYRVGSGSVSRNRTTETIEEARPIARTDTTREVAQTLANLATIIPSRPGAVANEPVVISSEEEDDAKQ